MAAEQVLYLSHDGLTDPLGQSQILPYVIGLSATGYRFTIISFEKENSTSERMDSVKRICQQHNINWIALPYHKSPPIVSTLYDVWTMRRTVDEIIRKNKISILHCRSYPMSLIGLAAKRKWDVKFIFDMRGFWADERVEGGLWNLKNPLYKMIYKFFKKKETEFLREADCIISLTQNAKSEIESWGIKTPITVIPTCVDLVLFDPANVSSAEALKLKDELKISESDFVLLYLGSWGTWYLTGEMLNFFTSIRNRVDAKFLIVSTDHIDLKNYRYAQDVIVRSAKRTDVPMYIALASAGVAFIKPSFSKKASSATKIAELLAMDIPVYVNGGWGDIEKLFLEYPQWIVDVNLPFESQVKIGIPDMKGSFRTLAVRNFNLREAIDRYNIVYQRLSKG